MSCFYDEFRNAIAVQAASLRDCITSYVSPLLSSDADEIPPGEAIKFSSWALVVLHAPSTVARMAVTLLLVCRLVAVFGYTNGGTNLDDDDGVLLLTSLGTAP